LNSATVINFSSQEEIDNSLDLLIITQGGLNKISVYDSESGKVIVKTPLQKYEQDQTLEQISQEYGALGVDDESWRLRSYPEQKEAIKKWSNLGIPIPSHYFISETYILMDYIPLQTYKNLLRNNNVISTNNAIKSFLHTIIYAHSNGVVFGDRWGPNEFVDKDEVLLFDFDIELDFPAAKEFELSQVIYYSLLNSRGNKTDVSDLLVREIFDSESKLLYDYKTVNLFLENHVDYFQGKSDGGIEREVSYFIDSLNRKFHQER
jgi:tRNA A-37 threonylcarbamoyl transferase component Bud32